MLKGGLRMTRLRTILLMFFCLFVICSVSSFKINQSFAQGVVFSSDDSIKSINYLRRQIFDVLKKLEENKSQYGIAVYSLDRREYYFKHNINSYFIPASLTKLFTTIAALSKFGVDFKVKTYVYSSGEIQDGVLNGNIYIYGTGDALLSLSDIDYLAEEIKRYGIKEVNGNIYADPSFFDSQTDRFVYSGDFDVVQKTQPITSLSIEKNIVTVVITAGSIYGKPVNVQVIPESDAIKVYNNAKVSRSIGQNIIKSTLQNYGGGKFIAQLRNVRPRQIKRESREIKVDYNVDKEGFHTIVVSGNLPAGTSKIYSYFIENPPLVVAGVLKKRMESAGIAVKGNIGIEEVKKEFSHLVAVIGRPLVEILRDMNKNSDNFIAEIVYKMIGAYDRKMTSNSKEATRYIFSLLDSLKISCLECKMYDGSGLSRRNRFSPESIIQLLEYAKIRKPSWNFDSLLSVSGYDGTLKTRMVGSSAEGRVFAKTGTHSNASGLAGYVKTLDNERLAFVFMFNGERVGHYKKIEDEICKVLSGFFYSHITE